MTKKAADETASEHSASQPQSTLGVRSAFLLIMDTSTRLFMPSVGGTVVGLWLDITLNTKPWFTIIGVIGGTVIALWLVYLQMKAVDKEKDSPR